MNRLVVCLVAVASACASAATVGASCVRAPVAARIEFGALRGGAQLAQLQADHAHRLAPQRRRRVGREVGEERRQHARVEGLRVDKVRERAVLLD